LGGVTVLLAYQLRRLEKNAEELQQEINQTESHHLGFGDRTLDN
jgi:hypothetical protein